MRRGRFQVALQVGVLTLEFMDTGIHCNKAVDKLNSLHMKFREINVTLGRHTNPLLQTTRRNNQNSASNPPPLMGIINQIEKRQHSRTVVYLKSFIFDINPMA